MKTKLTAVFILAAIVLAAVIVAVYPRSQPPSVDLPQPEVKFSAPQPHPSETISEAVPEPPAPVAAEVPALASRPHPVAAAASTNKLERLNQIREGFRTMAAGDPSNALHAAKLIADPTERESSPSRRIAGIWMRPLEKLAAWFDPGLFITLLAGDPACCSAAS